MSSLLFPLAIGAVALFLLQWAVAVRRRNAQSWDALVSRLQPGWDAADLAEAATPEDRWQQVQGARGLCAMYQNSKVMLEMANYAARNSHQVDRKLVAALRSDAMRIRLLVACALTQYAFHQLNESIGANAMRAATMYREMSARMADLLEASGGFAIQCAGA